MQAMPELWLPLTPTLSRAAGAWGRRSQTRGGGRAAAAPPPSSTAIGVLTFTPSVPSATSSLDTLPSSAASTSMVALSVSISAMMSPGLMVWPSLTSHLASLPSSMVGDSAGIRISVGISSGSLFSQAFCKCAVCASMLLVISLWVSPVCLVAAGSNSTTQHSSGAAVMCSTPRGTTWKSPSRSVTSGRSR